MPNPAITFAHAVVRNRNFILKAVNVCAIGAIVMSFNSWATQTQAAETHAKEQAQEQARSGERGPYATDGTLTGTAQGYGGPITSQVTIKNGYIAKVEIVDHAGETPAYYSQAERLTQDIVDAQTTAVDTVSGATFSSAGILNSTTQALEASNAGAGAN